MPERYQRPPGVDDETIDAVGKLTEALETIERARGHLHSFHQLTGSADFAVSDAARKLRDAGHTEMAKMLETELVGRNVLPDRWTYQVLDEYDETYYRCFRELEQRAVDTLLAGRRHLHEARMKQERRTPGHPDHTAAPVPEEDSRG
jgi:hypothetical protein